MTIFAHLKELVADWSCCYLLTSLLKAAFVHCMLHVLYMLYKMCGNYVHDFANFEESYIM